MPQPDNNIKFSSKHFNPILINPKAPNQRLEISSEKEDIRFNNLDLYDLLL